jgi:hypothetical protein
LFVDGRRIRSSVARWRSYPCVIRFRHFFRWTAFDASTSVSQNYVIQKTLPSRPTFRKPLKAVEAKLLRQQVLRVVRALRVSNGGNARSLVTFKVESDPIRRHLQGPCRFIILVPEEVDGLRLGTDREGL